MYDENYLKILDDEIREKDPSYLDTYGNNPMKRARFIAIAKSLWYFADTPVRL